MNSRDEQRICPKCSGKLEQGLMIDNTYGGVGQAEWAEGPPERSFWVGLKLKGKAKHPITTYRCERCGFLESYAKPASKAT